VDDEKQLVVEHEHDPFADPAHAANDLTVDDVDWRLDGAQDERAVQRQPLEPASGDVARQRVEIDDNVGKFGDVIS
jgi:hypothetical protein